MRRGQTLLYSQRDYKRDYKIQKELERHKKLMSALHNSTTGTLCPKCEGQALALLCDQCTQKIKEIAGVKYS